MEIIEKSFEGGFLSTVVPHEIRLCFNMICLPGIGYLISPAFVQGYQRRPLECKHPAFWTRFHTLWRPGIFTVATRFLQRQTLCILMPVKDLCSPNPGMARRRCWFVVLVDRSATQDVRCRAFWIGRCGLEGSTEMVGLVLWSNGPFWSSLYTWSFWLFGIHNSSDSSTYSILQ